MNSMPSRVFPLPVTPCTRITLVLGIPPSRMESRPLMPVLIKPSLAITVCPHFRDLACLFFPPRVGQGSLQSFCQPQPPGTIFRQTDELLEAEPTSRIQRSQDSVKTYPVGEPR